MPAARSWKVALGCTADKKALGSNDLDVIRIEASGRCIQRHMVV